MATGGCWILINGKKVAGMRGPDGIAVPDEPQDKPKQTTKKPAAAKE